MVGGVEHLHLSVRLDVAGRDLTLAAHLDIHRLHALGVQLGDDAFHVEDDLRHVFLYARDGGELMLDTGDLDGGDRGTGQRREQDAAQGVAQSRAIAALQGLDHVLAVGAVTGILHAFDARLFDFYHVIVTLLVAAADGCIRRIVIHGAAGPVLDAGPQAAAPRFHESRVLRITWNTTRRSDAPRWAGRCPPVRGRPPPWP